MLSRTPYKSFITKKLILILEKKSSTMRMYGLHDLGYGPRLRFPYGKSIRPDPDERTTGVSCVQIYLVWKQEKRTEVWT